MTESFFEKHDFLLQVILPMIIIMSIIVILCLYFSIVWGPQIVQDEAKRSTIIHTIENKTMSILNSKDLTCLQIQDLRKQSLQNDSYTSDPLYTQYSTNKARDLWNIMDCGIKWNWFEK